MTARRAAVHLRGRWSWAALAFLVLSGCGEEDQRATPPADAAIFDGGSCRPQSAAGFSPTWKPPQAMLNACSDQQITQQFRVCHGASADSAQCATFNRDPTNLRCRSCLYSTEDESAYGPMVILKNRVVTANVAGCLALVDGNFGDAGCGAGLQAFETCKAAVCIPACTTYEAYEQCSRAPAAAECARFEDDSACTGPSTYDVCLNPTTFEEYFSALGRLFCGPGLPAKPDAGSGDVDGGRPRRAMPEQTVSDQEYSSGPSRSGVGAGIGR
jgi:hypothetical protein